MQFRTASRHAAIFWLTSGGIFFFMDIEILGESAFAQPSEIVLEALVRDLHEPFFYAERHCCGSNLRITTNLPLASNWEPTISASHD